MAPPCHGAAPFPVVITPRKRVSHRVLGAIVLRQRCSGAPGSEAEGGSGGGDRGIRGGDAGGRIRRWWPCSRTAAVRYTRSASAAPGCALAGGLRHRRAGERPLSLPCRRTQTTVRCSASGSWRCAGFPRMRKACPTGLCVCLGGAKWFWVRVLARGRGVQATVGERTPAVSACSAHQGKRRRQALSRLVSYGFGCGNY